MRERVFIEIEDIRKQTLAKINLKNALNTQRDKYGLLAPMYDYLASMVFGARLIVAQRHFLTQIPKASTVLVIGGGTGRIIDWIFAAQPEARIVYIEASRKMLEYATAVKAARLADVQFIHGTQENIPRDLQADVVILPFLLDLFDETALQTFMDRVELSTTESAVCIVTDFVKTDRFVHRVLLKSMLTFFAIVTRSTLGRLPEWRNLLGARMHLLAEKYWMNGFICSAVFRRSAIQARRGNQGR